MCTPGTRPESSATWRWEAPANWDMNIGTSSGTMALGGFIIAETADPAMRLFTGA